MSKSRRTSDLVNSLLVNPDNSVNIHEGTQSPYYQLDTLATSALQPGMFGWNDAYGTADLRLKGNNVTLQLGQEILARVVNKTGANLLESEYKVVRVRIASEGGAQGQRLAVVLAQGDNDPDSATTLGVVTETIANNQEGFITILGNVNNINTTGSLQGETWVDGDVLYLSPTTPGALTKIKPVAPQHTVIVGYVVYAHANQGKIFVKVDNGYELDELHNVLITTPSSGQLLRYNGTVWENWTPNYLTSVPTLAQVTTAGNTTTNAINTGLITTTTTAVGNMLVVNGTNNTSLNVGNDSLGRAFIAIKGNLSATSAAGAYFTAEGYQEAWFNVIARAASAGNRYWRFGNVGSSVPNNTFAIQKLTDDGSSIALTALVAFNNGNIGINTTTDAGYKLDVNGTARFSSNVQIIGSTNTAASSAISIKNSANTDLLYIRNDGYARFDGTLAAQAGIAFLNSRILGSNQNDYLSINLPRIRIGGAVTGFDATTIVSLEGSKTASSNIARGTYLNQTLVAAANNDVLVGLDINPTFTNGAFTGVTNLAARIQGNTEISRTGADTQLTVARGGGASFTIQGKVNSTSQSEGVNLYWTNNTWLKFVLGSSVVANFSNVGNLLVGTSTDSGYKLDVNGVTRVSGTGTFNGQDAFVVRSSAQFIFRVNNDENIIIGRGGGQETYISAVNSGRLLIQNGVGASQTLTGGIQIGTLANYTQATGTQVFTIINPVFNPTGFSDANFSAFVIAPTINQSANPSTVGLSRGLYINPTLVSPKDFRAIETTVGKIIHQGLTNATHTNQVYYNTSTGELTYGALPTTVGYTGIVTIVTNPPGQQNLDFQNGLLVNVF